MNLYERNDKNNIWVMYKNQISTENSSQLYQTYNLIHQLSLRNIIPKLDHHTGGKWFILSPQNHKDDQLLSQNTPTDYPEYST